MTEKKTGPEGTVAVAELYARGVDLQAEFVSFVAGYCRRQGIAYCRENMRMIAEATLGAAAHTAFTAAMTEEEFVAEARKRWVDERDTCSNHKPAPTAEEMLRALKDQGIPVVYDKSVGHA